MRRRLPALLAAGLITLTGCANIGREPAPPAEPGYISELVLPAENGNAVQSLENYNPYAVSPLTRQYIYEPLMVTNTDSCEIMPWLATGYEWVNTTTLRLDIREGVQWSDGTPFTPADVAFTLNAGKQYPGIDKAGLWSDSFGAPATSVKVDGQSVVITFSGDAASKLDGLVNATLILPEHVYGSVGDITTYIDANPVGTGPFVKGAYNGRRLTLERNPNYWQADTIKIEQLSLEGTYDANSGALKLRSGALDLYTGDIPNPNNSVRGASSTDYYYAPAGTTVLAPNNSKFPTDNAQFRTAMAYAIDKEQLARKASFGVMQPASQTMLKLPLQQNQLPEKYQQDGGYIGYDPTKAAQILDEAGFTVGPDGLRTTPDGQPLQLIFSVQAGFIDYLAMADVIVRNFQAIGLNVKLIATDPNAVDSQIKTGDFDMVLDYVNGGCVRAKDLGGKLASNQISDDKTLKINVERYNDPETDKLVADFEATIDPEQQKTYTDQIIDIFVQQVPVIALQYAPQRLIYRTAGITGWPTTANPYPTNNMVYVLTHLRPTS
ncbi:hypothetical protein GIS00_01625 [Nakamurella sp. YIM 132087]|uniref:Solute-binding protein family 5 domain-containing protein n=1 Tax=Nakamurella alba TaxID=2665158 RepID=A0A7K1FIC9_9ACTN|nr:ABC transporter substrate-binding protein [Nakamurella alba]MTD12644.1 hypothetical protein [Nakamurella alba]